MKYSMALLAAAAGAMAQSVAPGNGTQYTTITTTAITTYCPYATTIVQGSKTYTVTEATTLTITDCPCTLTKPVGPTGPPAKPTNAPSTVIYTSCPSSTEGVPAKTIVYPPGNYTNPIVASYAPGASPTGPGVSQGTGPAGGAGGAPGSGAGAGGSGPLQASSAASTQAGGLLMALAGVVALIL